MTDQEDQAVGPLRRAQETIQALREQVRLHEGAHRIAVIGRAVRAPGGVSSVDDLWNAMVTGRVLIGDPPADRGFAAEGVQGSGVPSLGGYVRGALEFDAAFFGISPREARAVDPQHRLLLETVWEAFEDAAVVPAERGERTGVFIGITSQDYRRSESAEPSAYTTIGNGHCFAAGRIAHALNLGGPVIALDTACSSSLVALHTAARSLASGECDVAVVGGVNLILSQDSTLEISRTGALSPNGECRPFDARANGFVRGEGCAVVILKRHADAISDRDEILATVESTAINHDGRSAGFTAPNLSAQVRLLQSTLARAGRHGSDVDLVEAHGTGTPLGDPIELEAIAEALGRGEGRPLHIGALKAVTGHAEAAAGVLGFVKAVECVRRGRIPGQPTFATLNPRIDLRGTRLCIPLQEIVFEPNVPLVALISSFGMSGTNACVLITSAARAADEANSGAVPGFMISAQDQSALRELAASYGQVLVEIERQPDASRRYEMFARTATFGRTRLKHSYWVEGASAQATLAPLHALASGQEHAQLILLTADRDLPWQEVRGAASSIPRYAWQRRSFAIARADGA